MKAIYLNLILALTFSSMAFAEQKKPDIKKMMKNIQPVAAYYLKEESGQMPTKAQIQDFIKGELKNRSLRDTLSPTKKHLRNNPEEMAAFRQELKASGLR